MKKRRPAEASQHREVVNEVTEGDQLARIC